jgi:hypothetical protein
MKRVFIFGLIVLCAFFSGCAPQAERWQSELLYAMEDLGRDRLAGECSFMIFPIIINDAFDTSDILSPKRLKKLLHKIQNGAKVYTHGEFEKKYLASHGKDSLELFYSDLFKKDILSLASRDTVWSAIPGRYLLIIRLNEGMSIKSFEGVKKRKIVLESELWHTKRHEVVWRLQTAGYEMKEKVTDAEFIAEGIEEVLKEIPLFLSSKNEENW